MNASLRPKTLPPAATTAGAALWLLLSAAVLPAQTLTWGGGTGSWSTPGSWQNNAIPTASSSVVIGDAAASQTVSYTTASALTVSGISLDQTTAGTSGTPISNVLSLTAGGATLTDTSTLVLGTGVANATVGLTLTGSSTSSVVPVFKDAAAGGVAINSGGLLTFQFAASPQAYIAVAGNVTVGNGGKILGVIPSSGGIAASFGSLSSSSNSLAGTDTFTLSQGGLIQLQGSSASGAARIQFNGALDWAGTIQFVSTDGSTPGPSIILHGLTNTIESTALLQTVKSGTTTGAAAPLTLTISTGTISAPQNLTQTLNTAVGLGAIGVREFDATTAGVYTHKLTYTGSGTGGVGVVTFQGTGAQDIVQLGSDWTETNNGTGFLAASSNSGATLVSAGLDLNGFTFDGTASGSGWLPNKVSGVSTAWNITSSSGTGTLKASSFDFTMSGAGAGDSMTVGNNVVLQATGGNGTANVLSRTGGGAYSIGSGSTFLYSGTAAAATPATLASSSAIGALQVKNGALRLAQTAFGSQAVSVNGGGTLDFDGATSMTLTLASGQNFTANNATLALNLGTAFDQIVGGGAGTFSLANVTLAITQGAGFSTANTYQLFSGFAGGSESGLSVSGLTGYAASIDSTGLLSFSAVPEPGTVGLAVMGVLGIVQTARRRRA